MRLRTQLVLSYLLLVAALCAGGLLYTDYLLKNQSKEVGEATEKIISRLSSANRDLSEDMLTAYGQKLVAMKAEAVAGQLYQILGGKGPFDYDKLRENQQLRELGTQDVMTWDGVAGYVDVIDIHGEAVLHPNRAVEGHNFSEYADKYPEMWDLVSRSFTEPLVQGYYSFFDRDNKPVRKYLVAVRVPETPLVAVAAVSIDKFFLPIQAKIKNFSYRSQLMADEKIDAADKRMRERLRRTVLWAGLGALALGLAAALVLAGSLSKPIRRLQQAAKRLGGGDFTAEAPEVGNRETRSMARSFNQMRLELLEYMDKVRAETAARQAVESEIKIARQIQESLLPRIFPPFPERSEFSLYADNLAAKEVAGDFYDFFFVNERRLVVTIADVSDKGVPAALFMAVTRTLFKNICPHAAGPAEALTEANSVLCQDNDAAMFVTVFLAFYDPADGSFTYANAGHNQPFILRAGGQAEMFGGLGDVPLGVMDDYAFASGQASLEPGDTLALYTDGVTEATNPDEELFGEQRMLDILTERLGQPLDEMTRALMNRLDVFQAGDRFDDTTMLLLRREE